VTRVQYVGEWVRAQCMHTELQQCLVAVCRYLDIPVFAVSTARVCTAVEFDQFVVALGEGIARVCTAGFDQCVV
jgi:hypothetical protein